MTNDSPQNLQPLSRLTVVELDAIGPIPFVGLQLQQLGARVTRVCPPRNRQIGIELDAESDLLNRGKAHRIINLKLTTGQDELMAMLANTDVLCEGFRPGVLERLGLEPAELLVRFPRLIIARLSGYGRHGAYAAQAGHDINFLALSGVLAAIGTRQTPVVPLNLVADFGGGAMHLLAGILARLVQRGITGEGGIVDSSILAGTLGLTTMMHGLLAGDRWSLEREQNLLDGGVPFYRVYKTSDQRFVAVGALEPVFYAGLLKLTRLDDELPLDEQYHRQGWPVMATRLASVFATRTRDEWAQDALTIDCCVTPVLNFAEATAHPHNNANGWITQEPFPHPGPVLQFSSQSS